MSREKFEQMGGTYTEKDGILQNGGEEKTSRNVM